MVISAANSNNVNFESSNFPEKPIVMISEYYKELIRSSLNNTGLEKVIFLTFKKIIFTVLK